MSTNRSYQELFHPPFWQRLSLDQRVGLLQELENDQARQSGREPCKIIAAKMPDIGSCGELDPNSKTVKVNTDHIQHPALEFSAVETVLHEGRHAYQRDAITNEGLHHDPEQVQVWKENSAVYVSQSEKTFLIYRNQPLERDADGHAHSELQKIFDKLEQTHGEHEICRKYVGMVDAEASFVAEKSRAKYGDDFEARIERNIRKAYEITRNKTIENSPAATKECYRITFQKSDEAPIATITTVDKVLPDSEKEMMVKQVAHDFIYRSVSQDGSLGPLNVQIEKMNDSYNRQHRGVQRQIESSGGEKLR